MKTQLVKRKSIKLYEITVEVDESKLRDSSIEPDNATVEEMIKQVVQMKLDDQKWLDDTGISILQVYPRKANKSRDVNWDLD